MASNPAPLLSARDLRLAYGAQTLLDGASLAAGRGEKVGLVGRNGCGKSSLLRILAGSTPPDAGEVSVRRGLRVGLLPQEFALDEAATVRSNIAAGAADLIGWIHAYEEGRGSADELADLHHRIEAADGWNLENRMETLARELGTPALDAPVAKLSGGEKRRVALCRTLAGQPDLLLLDEPTNHLDADSVGWLETFLRGFSGGLVFVTHDRYFLDLIATRILELAGGRCYSHPGNYTAYLESKALRQEIAGQAERRRQRFLREELSWVRAGVRAQRSKARHRLQNFYEVAGLEAPPEEREMDLILPPPPPLGNTAVKLSSAGARVGPEENPRWLFRHLNLTLNPGECTGVVGKNGAGKTTLLRICLGQQAPDEGTVSIGRQVVFNHVDQGRLQLDGTLTVLQTVGEGSDKVVFGGRPLGVRAYLRRFLFPDERVNERVDRLSGGERARLLLAKALKNGGNVLVLDEPTNDLDLPSLRMLEEALADFTGSVLVVSHDRWFLDRICDHIVAFEDGGVFQQPGNYSYYLEKREARIAPRPAAPAAPSRPATPAAAKPRKLSFKEQRELGGMEAAVLAAEHHEAELRRLLEDPAYHVRHRTEVASTLAAHTAAREKVEALYERWAALESIRSGAAAEAAG